MQQFRWSGLSSFVNRSLRRLASASGEPQLRELHHALSTTSRRLEISVSLQRLDSAQLTPTTRSLRAWVAFLSEWEDLLGYVEAVRIATPLIEDSVRRQRRWKPPVRLYLRPMRGVYQLRQRRDGLDVSLPTPAVCFNPADFTALMSYMFDGEVSAKRHVLDRMQSEEFQAIQAELDVLAGSVDAARGETYDLNDIFDRINVQYFGGQVKRPKLFWSRSLTRRKFGHYDWVGDAVMISRTLDDAKVPPLVIEFVMYHELLHKTLGLRWSGRRQYAHTADFYRQERRFAQHAAAEASLKKLAK